MSSTQPTTDHQALLKQQSAEHAVNLVKSDMIVGLGTGSTAIFATRAIADRLKTGQLKNVRGYATSISVWSEAVRLGIPMISEEMPNVIDVTIDGADEVDPQMNLIKGGGGALTREKIVAQASRRVVIVVDESKHSQQLGTLHSLPMEVLAFGWQSQCRFLESLGAKVLVRRTVEGPAFTTDSGNLIMDCLFPPIADPAGLAAKLGDRAGIVEHGLFLGITTDLISAGAAGITHRTADKK